MRTMTMKKVISNVRLYLVPIAAVALLLAATAHAGAAWKAVRARGALQPLPALLEPGRAAADQLRAN